MNFITTNNGELPKAFASWNQLWRLFKENRYPINEDDIITYETIEKYQAYRHNFTVQYLKSKCFDEIKASPFTARDLREIQMAIHHFGSPFNPELVNRIQELLHLQYEAGNY